MVSILVVDDSSIDRQLMDGLLSKESDFDVWTAGSANDALEQMRQGMIDIVVTDLQMPENDGLSLVRSINETYNDIPSILVTAHGSEAIASAALEEGAAGYVSKTQLAQKLVETIRNVWLLMQAERSYEKLAQHTTKTEFKFELDNDASLIPALVDLAQQTMRGIADCESLDRLRLSVCLEQALLNGLYHGNLEIGDQFDIPSGDELPNEELRELIQQRLNDPNFNNRRVRVLVQIKRRRVSFVVRDDGKGFDHAGSEGNIAEGGRGIILMRHFMDEVRYNEKGNEVTLVKYFGIRKPSETQNGNGASTASDDDSQIPQLRDDSQQLSYGQLVSEQSGRSVELTSQRILIGRRKSCHVVIPQNDVSAHHCQLFIEDGWWCVKDLDSSNGIKINGKKTRKGVLGPDDIISVGKHDYRIQYSPTDLGAVGVNRPTLK